MMEMYREYRKNDGFVGLAYQDPKALFDSGIGDAVLENTATFIFLPNSQANKAGLERFNLNDEQIAFILGSGDRKERSEEHTSELQSLMRSSYAVFCLKKKNT